MENKSRSWIRHEQPLVAISVGDLVLLERQGYEIEIDIDKGMLYYEKEIPQTAGN